MTLSRNSGSFESICRKIRDSWGDLEFLVQLLVNFSQSECRKIRETYTEIYGEDLVQKIDQAGATFLSMLMLNPFERDAMIARQAFEQNDVDYKALMETFTCRKSSHVLLILQAYHRKYRRHLDLDIASIEPAHPYQKILIALSASHKGHHADISQHIAKCDARRLYQTGEGRPGPIDEAVVLEIFSKRSIPQLKLIFSSYKHIYGHNYTNFLKSGEMGAFDDALQVTVTSICNPLKYFAKLLNTCLNGTTTDKGALERVMVSRAEIDVEEIQRFFKMKYQIELKSAIYQSLPEGIYRDFLVALASKAYTC